MSEQPTASSPEADVFREYKKIKTLVREKRSQDSSEDYIKDVWPMIINTTESDEAKKLWLSHVTAHPLDKQGTAQSHYERLVLEDMDDEDSHIRRARLRMDGAQCLAPVWHVLNQTISPARYVKALREVTKGRRGEIAFAKMPIQVPQIRDRGASQVMMTRPRVTLENVYSKVEGEPYLVDTGVEVSVTRRGLKTTGYLTVQFANGTVEEMPYGTWQGIIWVKGPYNLIPVTDLKELNKPWGERRSLSQRLSQLRSRLVKLGSTQSGTKQ
ncbi:hypothetical protein XENOCAPTIV_005779 [Xenoophorus captivus]|uniref:Uncharacterized protein n=1 Tax=Xenoophorus captivus TaxID=1517983 RepID=A0ABV0SDI9_9TELE